MGGSGMKKLLTIAACAIGTAATADHELMGRDVDNGRVLYAENCAVCHGANLEGQPDWQNPGPDGVFPAPPHDETGHTWHHSNEELFEYTSLGGQKIVEQIGLEGFTSGMPGFEGALAKRKSGTSLPISARPGRMR